MAKRKKSEPTIRLNPVSAVIGLVLIIGVIGGALSIGYYWGRQPDGPETTDPLATVTASSPVLSTATPGAIPPPAGGAPGNPDDALVRQEIDRINREQNVRVEPAPEIPPQHVPGQDTAETASGAKWVIQISSREDLAAAQQDLEALQEKGLPGRIVPISVSGIRYFRVRLGEFNTKEEAVKYAFTLENRGVIRDYWITEQ